MTASPPAPATPPERCPTCRSGGYVKTGNSQECGEGDPAAWIRYIETWRLCPDCAGTGQRKEKAE